MNLSVIVKGSESWRGTKDASSSIIFMNKFMKTVRRDSNRIVRKNDRLTNHGDQIIQDGLFRKYLDVIE